jgi:hypothetical protein
MAIIEATPSRGNRNKAAAKGLGSLGEALTKAAEALPTPPVNEQPTQEAQASTETEVLKEEAAKPFLQSLGELNPGPTRRIFINDVEVTDAVIKQHAEDAKKVGSKEELRKEYLELLNKTYDEIDETKAKLRQADEVMAIQAYAAHLGKLEAIKNDLYAAGVVTPNEYNAHYKATYLKPEVTKEIVGGSISGFVGNTIRSAFINNGFGIH